MSALGVFALLAVVLLVAFAVLAQIPYGAEEPLPEPPTDEGVRPHHDYLVSRGWHVDGDLEAAGFDAPPVPCAAWSRTEDGLGPHTFSDALLLQLTEDVERLGGYEAFASLCDLTERGVER